MTFSQERIDAYAQLEAAILHLQEVIRIECGEVPAPSFLDNWLLITSHMESYDTDDDSKPLDDEEMKNVIGTYSKRGSLPVINQALAMEYLNYCERLNR
jgi:hypothetical protein